MRTHWSLVAADFLREYRIGDDELRAISVERFHRLLRGLSDQSRFRDAWSRAPKHVYDQADIDAITAMARR